MHSPGYDILRRDELLLDFTIFVEEKAFKVHKVVMAAESEFFRAMLRNDMVESKKNEAWIEDIDAETVEILLDFCYTKNIDITSENVADLLRAASRWQMDGLREACEAFLAKVIDVSNCLEILSQAVRERLDDLTETAVSYCCANFNDLVESEEFLLIDHEVLGHIIKDDRLAVDDEAKVLAAVEKWVKGDSATRKSYLDDLGPYIRFALIDPIKLVEASESDLIIDSTVCCNLIDISKSLHLLKLDPEQKAIREDKINTTPRLIQDRSYLYALRIYNLEYHYDKLLCYRYGFQSRTWTKYIIEAPTIESGTEFRPVYVDEEKSVYLIGVTSANTSCRIDLTTGRCYRDIANMTRGRSGAHGVAYDKKIFLLGGESHGHILDWNDSYDIIKAVWTSKSSMPKQISGFGAVAHKGYIYVAGGHMSDGSVSRNVYRYNILFNSWKLHSVMQEERENFDLCVCRNLLYAVGGNDHYSAEFYNEQEATWRLIPPTLQSNARRSICYDGIIHAIFDSGDMELYDPATRLWTSAPKCPSEPGMKPGIEIFMQPPRLKKQRGLASYCVLF